MSTQRANPSIGTTLRAIGRRLFLLRRIGLTYLLLVAVSMSIAASLSTLTSPIPAKHMPNADCDHDKAPSCLRPTLV
jgi:hypothetical protein